MKKIDKKKKNKIIKIIAIVGVFLLVFGISFALFTITLNGTKKNRIGTGKLSLQLLDENYRPIYEEADEDVEGAIQTGYGIDIANALPITYEEGMETQPFYFIVKNNGNIPAHYDLKILDENTNTLGRGSIRYVLTQADYNPKANGTLYNGGYSSNQIYSDEEIVVKSDGYTKSYGITAPLLSSVQNNNLDSTTIFPGEEIHYTLKLWVDYDATVSEASNKVYEANLKIDGTQAVKWYENPTGPNTKYTIYSDGTLVVSGSGNMGNGIVFDDETPIEYGGGPFADYVFGTLGSPITGQTANDDFMMRFNIAAYGSPFIDGTERVQYYQSHIDLMSSCVADPSGQDCPSAAAIEAAKDIDKLKNTPKLSRILIQEGVTSISNYAFPMTGANVMVTIPSTVTQIGTKAFRLANFYKLIVPEGVTHLNTYTFDVNMAAAKPGNYVRGREIELPSTVLDTDTVAIDVAPISKIKINQTEAFVTQNWNANWLRISGNMPQNYKYVEIEYANS